MNHTTEPTTTGLDDNALQELAAELLRLATGLKRDLQRNAVLPGLSDLTAMRPLQAVLTEALSARVCRSQATHEVVEREESINHQMPGYLQPMRTSVITSVPSLSNVVLESVFPPRLPGRQDQLHHSRLS